MSTKNLKLEYREYKLPEDFPLLVMTPQISTASAWVEEPKLHFHNCMEIGLMHGENHSLSFENPYSRGIFLCFHPIPCTMSIIRTEQNPTAATTCTLTLKFCYRLSILWLSRKKCTGTKIPRYPFCSPEKRTLKFTPCCY